MLKKLVHLQNNVFYSPSHNTFFKLESIEDLDYSNLWFEIKGDEEKLFEYLMCNCNNLISRQTIEDEFPECLDPYNKTLDRLCNKKINNTKELKGLIEKIQGKAIMHLKESPFSVEKSSITSEIPPLYHVEDYVDYDNILSDFSLCTDNKTQSILHKWINDCEKIQQYDERCLMILKCIGFLPAFSQKADKIWFLEKANELTYSFSKSDIHNYGRTDILILARSVIAAAIEYIKAQLEIIIPEDNNGDLQKVFSKMLDRFLSVSIPEKIPINPLLLVAYYHYLGLVFYRNYLYTHLHDQLIEAKRAMEKALQYTSKVDMHLQIWKAFLTYNLGRVYSELEEHKEAIKNIQIAVSIRQSLLNSPFFSKTIKHDLCFEYLLACIVETDIKKKAEKISPDEAQAEYLDIKTEAENEFDPQDIGSSSAYIYRLLKARII